MAARARREKHPARSRLGRTLGARGLSGWDWSCGACGVLALTLWALTGRGTAAIALAIAAELSAGLPTITKTWSHPESETVGTYLASGAGSGITLLTAGHLRFASYGFPLTVTAECALIVYAIALRPALTRRGLAARGIRRAAAGPPADVLARARPGPAAPVLHHERRAGRLAGNGSSGADQAALATLPSAASPEAEVGQGPGIARPGPAAPVLHHERRAGRLAGKSPLPAAPAPAGAYRARPPGTGQAALGFLAADGNSGRALESRAVAAALASLCPDHRQVIVGICYRGWSVDEAAAALGISAGTAKTRTFYALKAFRLALQEQRSDFVTTTSAARPAGRSG
jgi:hypothetical protein